MEVTGQYYAAATTATTASSYADSVKGERESIVKEFEWAITDLQKVVSELAIRLQPVLVPKELVDADGVPMAEPSPVRQRLYDLQATTGNIRGLLARLEV